MTQSHGCPRCTELLLRLRESRATLLAFQRQRYQRLYYEQIRRLFKRWVEQYRRAGVTAVPRHVQPLVEAVYAKGFADGRAERLSVNDYRQRREDLFLARKAI